MGTLMRRTARSLARLVAFAAFFAAIAAGPVAADTTGRIVISAENQPAVTVRAAGGSPACLLLRESGNGRRADYCVYTAPVTITVLANEAWSGVITARDATGQSRGATIASSAIRYDTVPATTFAAAASSPSLTTDPIAWVPAGSSGVRSFDYYFFLRLNQNDAAADFAAVVTFTVTTASGLTYALDVPITFTPTP